MGHVKMSGVVPAVSAPVTWPAVFADATWEQVIEACQTSTVPATWEIGDQKSMTINGADYLIDIIGKNHDTYTAGGTAPLTFQMHDCYIGNRQMNPSTTNLSWSDCDMRSYLANPFVTMMPSEVRSNIKAVNKLTVAGNQGSTISTVSDTLFLLSEMEVIGSATNGKVGEGAQYAYYASGNSPIKSQGSGGSNVGWWTRTPYKSDGKSWCMVNNYGVITYAAATSYVFMAPAFCF